MAKRRTKPRKTAAKGTPSTNPELVPDIAEEELAELLDDPIPTRSYQMLPMVGLGGSAGSIPALQQFFRDMPADSGMVFVVILHLSPEYESSLAELLQRSTAMTVEQVNETATVRANHVYVIPPGKALTSADGHLRLSEMPSEHGKRVAVDLFFRTLADTHGPQSTAIVLSGADADGSIGIKRVKERGGLTIAQDPDEAAHASMPRSAIATGMIDWVLRVAEMPERLLKYRGQARRLKLPPEDGPQPARPVRQAPNDDEAALRDVLTHLRTRTGRDFSYYKRATIVRRVARRMQVNGVEDMPEYLTFLRTHAGEAGALLQDLLISVTNFFRDRDAFDALEHRIPDLFKGKSPSDQVRVWVPACATGEEAYSVAMLLAEHARTVDGAPQLQVFATDLDEEVIRVARDGIYPETIAADVSDERMRRFFAKEHRGYRVRREIRESVLFAAHDLLKDSPFSRIDLISCRNLLIYLDREAQKRAFEIFHFALNTHGLLFLGMSESAEDSGDLFSIVDKKHRIYAHRPTARIGLPVPIGTNTLTLALQAQEAMKERPTMPAVVARPEGATPLASTRQAQAERAASWSELHFKLLERFGPPSVIVNQDHDIVHLSNSAGRFLQFSGGEMTRNLLRAVHPMLRLELRAALYRTAQTAEVAQASAVPIDLNGKRYAVDMQVAPAGDIAPDFLLVTFDAKPLASAAMHDEAAPVLADPVAPELEREIEHLKSTLRDTVEQYEASTEELKASNEELQAMNEELRSASEELESSREELQSINEELTTVNHELKNKIDELGHANSDMHNLMASTSIATVFLDRNLHIMRFTPSAVSLFNLIPGDIGRPLVNLKPQLQYPELASDAAAVMQRLIPIDREVRDEQGHWYLARLLPYRTLDDHIAGVVLNFIDISDRKQIEEKLRLSQERRELALQAAEMGAWDYDLVANICRFDARAQEMYGVPSDTLDHRPESVAAIVHPDDVGPLFEAIQRAANVNGDGRYDIDYRIAQGNGQYRWLRAWGKAEFEGEGAARRAVRIVGASRDITAEKEAERRLSAELAAAKQLQAVSTELISEQEPEALYAQLLDAAMALMRADAASLQILDPDEPRLRLAASRNFHPDSAAFWQWVDADSRSACGSVLRTNERIVVNDVETSTEMDGQDAIELRRSGLRAVQSSPLVSRDGRPVGVISTHWREPHQASASDFRLFDVLARQAGDLIERTQAQETLSEEFRNTQILHDLALRLVSAESIQTIYEDILSAAISITRAKAGTVQALDAEKQELVVLATRGFSPRTEEHFERVDARSTTSCGLALRTGTRSYVNFDPASTEVSDRLHVEDGVLSAQSTPLVSRSGQAIGMVSTHWGNADHRPSERELRFLDLLARQAADLIEQRAADQAIRESDERNALLVRFADAARGLSDPALVAETACRMLNQQLGTIRSAWAQIDWAAHEYVAEWVFLADGTRAEASRWPLDATQPFAAEHLAGRTVAYDDVESDARIPASARAAMAARGIRSGIAVPVMVDGTLRAVFNASQPTMRHWHPREIELAHALAERAWAEIERARAEQALRASEERQAFLLKLSDALRPLTDSVAVIATASEMVGRYLDAGRCGYGELPPPYDHFVVERDWTNGMPSHRGRWRLADFGDALVSENRAGRTLVIDDALADERSEGVEDALQAAGGLRATIGVPLIKDGKWVAAFFVHDTKPRRWTKGDVELCEEVAERIWAAVERARAEAGLRESEVRQAFLVGFSDAVRGLTDPVQVATTACRMLLEQLGVDRAHWAEVDWTTEEFVTLGSVHLPGVAPIEGRFPLATWEPYSASHREGRAVVVDNTQTDPRTDSAMRDTTARMEIGADLAAPVLVAGRLSSVLAVKQRHPRRWTHEEIALVEGVAARCWAEVGRARAEAALRDSEEKYRNLFEWMGQGYSLNEIVRDAEGAAIDLRYLELNPAFERLTGASLSEARGRLASEVFPGLDRYWVDICDRAARTGVIERVEHELTPNGRWYQSNFYPIGRDRVLSLYDDITDRKLREQHKDYLLKLSDALRPLADPVQIKMEASRVLGEELGVNRALYAEVVGDNWWAERGYVRDVDPLPTGAYSSDTYGHWIMQTYRRGESLIFEDVRTDARFTDEQRAAAESASIIGAVGVPLVKSGELLALLSVHTAQPRTWTAHDIAIIEETAERTWAAVERARAEEALRASEEKYRTLFESIDEGFLVHEVIRDQAGRGIDLRLLEANPALTRLTGLGRENVGKRGTEFMPNLEQVWVDTFDRVARTGVPERTEEFHQDTDRWYNVHVSKIRGAERQVAVVYDDVTIRKRAEIALRASEERQAFLLTLSDALTPLRDASEIKATASRLLGEHLGVGRAFFAEIVGDDWIVGDAYNDGSSPLAPGRYPAAEYGRWTMDTLRAGGVVAVADTATDPRLAPSEREALQRIGNAAVVGVPLVRHGEVVAVLSLHSREQREWTNAELELVQEVADRTWPAVERARVEESLRVSEAKYRTLFESIDEGFVLAEVLYDTEGRPHDALYLEGNPAASRLTGVSDYSRRLLSHAAPGAEPYWLEIYDRVARTGVAERLERYASPLDRWYDFHVSRVPDEAPDGTPRVAVVFQEITARKRAEAALRASEERQAFLLRLSDALRAEPAADAVADRAIRMLIEHMRLDRSYIVSYRLEEDRAYLVHQRGNDTVPPLPDVFVLSDYPAAFRAIFDQTLVIEDELERQGLSEAERRNSGRLGMRAMVAATLRRGEGRPLWSLVAISSLPRRWTQGDIELVEEVAERTWAAMERARAVEALKQAHDSLEARVRERTAEVQSLFRRLVSAQEEERRRIARDIHDHVGQQMTALRMNIAALGVPEGGPAAEQLKRTAALAEELDNAIDFLTWELRPAALDHLGLPGALAHLVSGWSERFGIHAEYDTFGVDGTRFAPAVETNLYRLTQEALHNVYKHAQASRVSVLLEHRDGRLALVIEDDGLGFTVGGHKNREPGSFGLMNMRERATLAGGELTIDSTPGHGTTLIVRVPVRSEDGGPNGETETPAR